jgi:hypothetical protein
VKRSGVVRATLTAVIVLNPLGMCVAVFNGRGRWFNDKPDMTRDVPRL